LACESIYPYSKRFEMLPARKRVMPMLTGREKRSAMKEWLALGNGLAGFAVGLFVHAIPASWWPRWLRDLVGKKE
jgi:hypothetical protein